MATPPEPPERPEKEGRLNDDSLRHFVDREYFPYSDAWHYRRCSDDIYERARSGRIIDDPNAYYQEYERLRRRRKRRHHDREGDRRLKQDQHLEDDRETRHDRNHDDDREPRQQHNRSACPGAIPPPVGFYDPNGAHVVQGGDRSAGPDDGQEEGYEHTRDMKHNAKGPRKQDRDFAGPDNDRMGARVESGRRRQPNERYQNHEDYPGAFLYNQRPSRHASQRRSNYENEGSSAYSDRRHGSRHGSKRHGSAHHRHRSRSSSRSVRVDPSKPKYTKGRAPSVEPAQDPYRPKEQYTILKAVKAAGWAGLVEGIRCRTEPGPWSGQKGKRVLCAASVGTVIGALRNGQNQSAGRMPYAEALMTGFYATDFLKRVGRNTKHQENAYVEQRKWREERDPDERKQRQVKRHHRRSA